MAVSYHSASQWLLNSLGGGESEKAGYADLREFDKHEGSPTPLGPIAASARAGAIWGAAVKKKEQTKVAKKAEDEVCCCKATFLLTTTALMTAVSAILFGLWTAQVPIYVPARAGVFHSDILMRVNNTVVQGTPYKLFEACGSSTAATPSFLSLTVAWSARTSEFTTREEWSGGLTIKTKTTFHGRHAVSTTTKETHSGCDKSSISFFGQAPTPQVWALEKQVASVARPGGGENVTLFSGVLNERIVGALSDRCIAKTLQDPSEAGSLPVLVMGYCDGDYQKPCPALPAMALVLPSEDLAALRKGTVSVSFDEDAVASEISDNELC